MSIKIQLIYFEGCPNFQRAKEGLLSAGYEDVELVRQDELPEDSAFKGYSSPTILVGDQVIFGSKTSTASCSVGKFEMESIHEQLEELISKG
jgi:hypothetical protein